MRLNLQNPWQAWNQMLQLHQEAGRLFNQRNGVEWSRTAAYPAVNVWEHVDSLHVEAELPGLKLEDLEIYVTGGNQLTVKGERKLPVAEKGVWHRQERNYGSFVRTLTLPFPVNADKVEAKFENGVLVLDLAKHESAKPRKITVKAE